MKNLIPKAAVVQTPGSFGLPPLLHPHPWAGQVTDSLSLEIPEWAQGWEETVRARDGRVEQNEVWAPTPGAPTGLGTEERTQLALSPRKGTL